MAGATLVHSIDGLRLEVLLGARTARLQNSPAKTSTEATDKPTVLEDGTGLGSVAGTVVGTMTGAALGQCIAGPSLEWLLGVTAEWKLSSILPSVAAIYGTSLGSALDSSSGTAVGALPGV